jgi:excinuclease ABC subunit C
VLEDVPGVGPARRKVLLKHFGSVRRLREASLDELLAVPGLPEPVARTVYACFREEGDAGS